MCAIAGTLVGVLLVACLNPMPEEFPSNDDQLVVPDAVGNAGTGGAPPPQPNGSGATNGDPGNGLSGGEESPQADDVPALPADGPPDAGPEAGAPVEEPSPPDAETAP